MHRLIQAALDDGRADDALPVIDAALTENGADREMLTLRVRALLAIGQFELACDTAAIATHLGSDNAVSADQARTIEAALASPPVGSENPDARSYRSEVPTEFLQRMQIALHHQTYGGVQIVKSPLDLMVYQQLIFRLRPGAIIEVGSKAGGSALFFGDLLRNFGIDGRVLSYDLVPVMDVDHPLVTFEYGNARRLEEVLSGDRLSDLPHPFLVVEDADHTRQTTLAVLKFFHSHLHPGDWIVIEDGNLSSIYPDQYPDCSSGPHLALREFFRHHADDYRVAAELCDMYSYNATTSTNGILERLQEGGRRATA